MFRKSRFTILAAAILIVSGSIVASAQVGELHGHVFYSAG